MYKLVTFLFLMFAPLGLYPQSEIVPFTGIDDYINLSNYIYIFVDKSRKATIQDILHGEYDDKFILNKIENPNFGVRPENYWVRLSFYNDSMESVERLLEYNYPLIDYLTFYTKSSLGKMTSVKTGDMLLFNSRSIKHRNFLFNLKLQPKETLEAYFLIQSQGSNQIPIFLWSPIKFIEREHNYQLFLGFYYGTFLIMFFYNLFIYFTVRDLSYLFYILYILGYTLFQANFNGLFFQYIFPNFPILANKLMPFSIGMALFFGALFTRYFIQTEKISPLTNKIISFVLLINLFTMVFSFFLSYKTIVIFATASSIPFTISIFSAAFVGIKKRYRPAYFFTIAWTVYLVGMAILALKQLGILPMNPLTNYSIQIGSVLEVTLLSLGLGDRINLLIKEKKNEELKRLIIEKRNRLIEADLENARKIQHALMPFNIPIAKEMKIALKYLPADKVGGDICGFQEHADGSLGIFIGDVSGHGIPAALISLIIKEEFDYLSRKYISPAVTLKKLNKKVFDRLAGQFVTFFYCIIKNDSLVYANAGHPPPLLYNHSIDRMQFLNAKGRAIGIVENNKIEEGKINFSGMERLVLYTDGIIEAGESNLFNEERFIEFIKYNKKLKNQEFLNSLLKDVFHFIKRDYFNDDVTVIVVDKL